MERKERNTEELMELVNELREFFKRHELRDYKKREEFLRKLAMAQLLNEMESAENE